MFENESIDTKCKRQQNRLLWSGNGKLKSKSYNLEFSGSDSLLVSVSFNCLVAKTVTGDQETSLHFSSAYSYNLHFQDTSIYAAGVSPEKSL